MDLGLIIFLFSAFLFIYFYIVLMAEIRRLALKWKKNSKK